MRRLRDFQSVLLQSGDEGAASRVVAVQGGEVVLLLDDPSLLELARVPRPATISFTPGVHPAMLTGFADQGPLHGTARFAVVDPTHRPEPRRAARMPLEVPATVTGAGPPAAATTVDIGRGGVLLIGWTAAPGTPVTVVLTLPGADDRLAFQGQVTRSGPQRAAIAFADDGALAAQDLASFVLRCRGVLAGRLAQRAA